ncbi:MAG: hypothetical protein KDC54_09190, partial [Lewinella sp.]|nr:hypothetical protein [Lewinella sp.]
PSLAVPEIIIVLGLSMFVYTVGVSSGPAFFATFRRRGFRDLSFVLAMLILSAGITVALHFSFGFDASVSAGVLAGSSTNTASLAGLVDLINNTQPAEAREAMSNAAVVGYSLSYPMGVLGVMFAIWLCKRLLRIDFTAEERSLQQEYPLSADLERYTIEITNEAVVGKELRDLFQRYKGRVVFGRMERGGRHFLPNMDVTLEAGDRLVIVGSHDCLAEAIEHLGRPLDTELTYDRTEYDVRRIFVSNPEVAGEKLASLNLPEKFSLLITRVQRGDNDLLANGETVLELGDRVLLVARRRDLPRIQTFFGNSYEALSHINLLSFGSGMALGLLLGMVSFQLPGGLSFNLGFAGGPLIVALILGALRRTGPIVWTLPYSANLTLRQVGLILLLAGIGIRSGHTFLATILEGGGGFVFLAGAIIATTTALLTLFIGYKLLRIPFSLLMGMVATQPAILDYAIERAGNKLPTIGYTLMLPLALITKILFVQVLFAILN